MFTHVSTQELQKPGIRCCWARGPLVQQFSTTQTGMREPKRACIVTWSNRTPPIHFMVHTRYTVQYLSCKMNVLGDFKVQLPNMLLHVGYVAPLELNMHTISPGGRLAGSLQWFLLHEAVSLSSVKPRDGFYTDSSRGYAQLCHLL